MIVRPSTTWEFSDRPLKAATVLVVRLFAAAIDHSVSPGCTVCGTAADAGAAGIAKTMQNSNRRLGRNVTSVIQVLEAHRVPANPPREPERAELRCPASQGSWHARMVGARRPQAMGAEVVLVRTQLAALEPGPDPL